MRKIIVTLSAMALLTAVSCSEDRFLEAQPTSTVSTPAVNAKLNGLYVMMVNAKTGGTSYHTDFGQKGMDVMSDLLSADMALARDSYGHYREIANLTAMTNYSDLYNYIPWRYYYRVVKGANDVINDLGGNNVIPAKAEDKYLLGQAKAIRAYAYFYLLQFYTTEYNPDELAIPLYLEFGAPAAPKSKQSEVYAAVVQDLKDAIDLLQGFNRANRGMINQDVAKGLLAYTYAAMGENALVAQYSKEIIARGIPTASKEEIVRYTHDGANESGGGFNSLDNNKSWMWGFDLTTDNNIDLISWWGQMDVFTYSYQWAGNAKVIDKELYESIKSDDIRKNQFAGVKRVGSGAKDYVIVDNTTAGTSYSYVPVNKFFAPDRGIATQRKVITDYVYMRVDEFHLLAAEALAKTGDDAGAKTILKDYLKSRIKDITYIDTLSGKALQDEIYKNTRIEFWGEGKSYLAMKRNKATVKRGSNHQYYAGSSYNYNDTKLTFKIPQAEILNNPHIQ